MTGARSHRGSATLLVAIGMLVVVLLAGLGLLLGATMAGRSRVQGAADLAALAGAEVQRTGGLGWSAARASAERNRVRLLRCGVSGDEVEFVVSVRVAAALPVGLFGLRSDAEAEAYAGVVTGAPA